MHVSQLHCAVHLLSRKGNIWLSIAHTFIIIKTQTAYREEFATKMLPANALVRLPLLQIRRYSSNIPNKVCEEFISIIRQADIISIPLLTLQKTVTPVNRVQNVLYKSIVVGFLAISLYALSDFFRFVSSDPSEGRKYAPASWPPPPEQRNQKHPKWKGNANVTENASEWYIFVNK